MEKYIFDSNIGKICVLYSGNIITKIELNHLDEKSDNPNSEILKIAQNIVNYLDGRDYSFQIPNLSDYSPFEQAVLTEIYKIEYGQTMSYKELAKRAGFPKAIRACGTVCRKNVFPIIIPCHRVIKSDGSLGNYNGGIRLKEWLINLESNFKNG